MYYLANMRTTKRGKGQVRSNQCRSMPHGATLYRTQLHIQNEPLNFTFNAFSLPQLIFPFCNYDETCTQNAYRQSICLSVAVGTRPTPSSDMTTISFYLKVVGSKQDGEKNEGWTILIYEIQELKQYSTDY